MNIKLKTNLMLFVLVLVIALSCGVTAYAQISQSPSNSNIKYMYNSELDKAYSYTSYNNWYDEHEYYGKCSVSGGSYWATAAIKTLMNKGALYGIEHNGKKFIPAGNYIMGNDALSLAIFFHWPAEQNDRKSVYNAPVTKFKKYDTANLLEIVKFGPGSFLKRKDAALILAGCVQIKSGGAASLSNYSSTGVGYDANGKRLDGFSANNYEDTSAVNKLSGLYIQAFSLLMDMDVCQGKIVYDEDFESSTQLAPNDNITYEEFYCWLVNVSEAPPPEKPAYSLSAKVEVTATNATVNYKDFLKCNEDGQAQITVTTNASNSTGNPNIEHYLHKIVETKPSNIKGREIDSGKMVANGGTKFFRTLTYFANTIKAKDITSSTDKENSKKAVTEDLRSGKGDCTYKITYEGSVTAYNTQDGKEVSDTATESTTGSVILYNNAPYAECKAYTLNGVTEGYKNNFFYIGKPIKIKDLCYDKEDDNEYPETVQYRITKLGNDTSLASSINFDNAKI